MTKPVDLIVANTMHLALEMVPLINGLHKAVDAKPMTQKEVNKLIARRMLAAIAQDARIEVILAALAACKAPSTLDMIGEGLQAVRDAQ